MAKRAKPFARRLFKLAGVEVRRPRPAPSLRLPGFQAGTILDVGAADGTPQLYSAYPEARIVAFDPIAEQLSALKVALAPREVELIEVALGSNRGEVDLHIPNHNVYKSSLCSWTELTAGRAGFTTRQVKMMPLDEVAQAHQWPTPYVLKIDTEGYDLEVLRGATDTLTKCAAVYCEISIADRFESGYHFRDVATFMFEQGFDLADVPRVFRHATGPVLCIDSVWTPQTPRSTADDARRSMSEAH
jgi:FkbM family methyltransferase